MIVYVVTEASVLHLEGYITSLKFNGAKGSDQGYPRVFGFITYLSLYQSIMSLQDTSLHFSAF